MTEAPAPSLYEQVALSSENRVVAEFARAIEARGKRYQSKAELEHQRRFAPDEPNWLAAGLRPTQ
ncbi:MAG: hypothetical protein LBF50_00390 [Azoarcus sp.]|jgi:hypothetical protein|nr:hypothetical protein [Azoarcus sp.]